MAAKGQPRCEPDSNGQTSKNRGASRPRAGVGDAEDRAGKDNVGRNDQDASRPPDTAIPVGGHKHHRGKTDIPHGGKDRLARWPARQRQQQLATAVIHSKTLTGCPDSGDEHAAASTAFRVALAQANQLAEQINSTRDDVSNARARLAAADEYRRTHAATIAEGEQAKIVLHRKLRQRITDGIGDRALFPAWFTTALGYSPPADGTTQWIAAATELIAYRIAYAITDPAVALGPRPAPGQEVRAAWYNSLTATLRNQRQWP